MRKHFCITIFLIHSFFVQGQQNLSFKLLDNELLKSADILKLHVDKTGITWILTNNGFMSFDGSEVKYFKDTLPGRYSVPIVSFLPGICEDRNGKLYAWKYETGLICFDPKNGNYSGCEVKGNDSLLFKKATVRELLLDQDNIFWIASTSGLIKYSRKNPYPRFIEFSEKNMDYLYREIGDSAMTKQLFGNVKKNVWTLTVNDSDPGKLWVANANCLYEFDKLKAEFATVFTSDPANPQKFGYVISGLQDAGKEMLVFSALGGGIGVYSKKEKDFHFFLRDSSIYRQMGIRTNKNIATGIFPCPTGGFYVSYNDAPPCFFDAGSGKQSVISSDSSLKGYKVFVDRAGRVWAFTRSRLYYSDHKQLAPGIIDVSFQKKTENAKNLLASIYWDKKENQYYAGVNFSDGVFVWNSDFSRSVIYPSVNPPELNSIEPVIWDIVNVNGTSWAIGLGNKLQVLDKSKNSYRHYTEVPFYQNKFNLDVKEPQREVIDLLKTSSQDFYILTGKGEVFKFDSTDFSTSKIITCKDTLTKSAWGPGKLLEGVAGELFATDYHTVFKLNLVTGETPSFLPETLSPSMAVNLIDVAVDRHSNVWVASGNNDITCYSGKDFKIIGKVPGNLKLNLFSNIVVTPENLLLIGEGNYLTIYDINKNKVFRYNYRNGLRLNSFNKVLYENGYVFLAYENEVQYIQLKELLREQESPIPYLTGVAVYGNEFVTDSLLKWQHFIQLSHEKNFLTFRFSALEYDLPDQVKYEYRIPELDTTWIKTDYFNRGISYLNLKPGDYSFQLRADLPNAEMSRVNSYNFSILPAWWQTSLFKLFAILFAGLLISGIVFWRIHAVRKEEQAKSKHEKQLLELEAKALRAQMNPHFIFNSLNSIKSLINKNENDIAANYLTTFSKLIRTLFQNSDKREVSLFEELETCKLYTQLEKMRFANKVEFVFNIDESLDLKDIKVPALILQPFIENAIWHGLVPKDEGGKVIVLVKEKDGAVECIIDDNGIGRELSRQYKTQYRSMHESKGIGLTQSRLELDKLLNDREDSIRIIDKKDEEGRSLGTTVIITFKEK